MLKQGSGATVEDGDSVVVQYTGVLWDGNTSSTPRGRTARPRTFVVSASDGSQVIPGFSKAIIGQQVGSQVGVVVPPVEGYGDQGNAQRPRRLDALLRDRHPRRDLIPADAAEGRQRPSMIAPVPGA